MSPHQKFHLRILSVLCVLTFAGLLWVEKVGEKEATPQTLLAGIDVSTVVGLRIAASSHHLELLRAPSGWRLGGPTGARADSDLIRETIENVAAIEASPVHGLEYEEANIGAVRMEMEVANGEPAILLFGRPSPVGSGRYVAIDGAVHLTTKPLPTALISSSIDLRSKRPVFASISQIGAIEIGGRAVPIEAQEGLSEALLDLRIDAFDEQPPPSSPGVEVAVRDHTKQIIQVLQLCPGEPWLIELDNHWYPVGDGLNRWSEHNPAWFQ